MKYYTILPPAILARYVRSFWVLEGTASQNEPYIYRGYADGCTELIFHYLSPFDTILSDGSTASSFSAGIHAQTRTFSRSIVYSDFAIFGCYLYPYAIPAIFGYPADDLTDQMTDISFLLGSQGRDLEEQIMLAASTERRINTLSRFLIDLINKNPRDLPAFSASINDIIESRGRVDVLRLSDKYCLSHRQFERKFKEFSGFSPKLYSRITRFQSALMEYGSGRSLTDIAYRCGYYDQSHFIKDFKEFSGYNPKAYFAGTAEGSEYLAS